MCAGGGARNVSIVVTAHNDSSSFLFKKNFRSRNYIRYIHNDSFDPLIEIVESWTQDLKMKR